MKWLELHPDAEEELELAAAHYEVEREGSGSKLTSAVDAALEAILENPSIGARYRRTRIRYFVVRKYRFVIYYQNKRRTVRVYAIAHGSRRQGYWWQRLRTW